MTAGYWSRTDPLTVGGSDVAAILGLSPYATPTDVWRRLTTGEVPTDEDSTAMQRGRYLEGGLLDWYTDQHAPQGCGIKRDDRTTIEWRRATLDASVWVDGTLVGIVEVKTDARNDYPGGEVHDWTQGEPIPPHYACQIAWYLHITGAQWCDVVSLGRDQMLACTRLHRDEAVIGAVVRQVEAWRTRYVLTGTPPPPTSHEDVASRQRPTKDPIPEATEEQAALMVAYIEATDAAREAAKTAKALRLQLAELADGTPGLTAPGMRARWTHRKPSERIDAARLRRDWPDVAAECVTTTAGSCWLDVRRVK